ncbi:MAG: TonB-dependent receptor plug domain-containing protein [Bacteroidales bacterium]|nr:TonB-dependent receptor plug domain-containing protein [Bacteroidales bacterium]
MFIIKLSFIITMVTIFMVITPLCAQKIDSSLIKIDTCSIFLNIEENINSLYSGIEIVKDDQFNKIYSINILSSLKGKLNGVDIQTGTWGNNASSVFFIKGNRNFFSNNQPLVILDGIPIKNQLSSSFGLDLGNLINDWNIDDIESITILKNGQAASLYGNQAGNGAIIIQTKTATQEGIHININSSLLANQIADYPNFQNKYGQGYNGEFAYYDGLGSGLYDDYDLSWGPPLNGQLITQFDGASYCFLDGKLTKVRGGDIWIRNQTENLLIDNQIIPSPWLPHPDNMKNYFKTAMTYANNIGISLADKNSGVRFSYTNVYANNVTPNSKLTKNTIGVKLNHKFFNQLKLFGSFQNTIFNNNNLLLPGGSNEDNPMYFFAWLGRQVDTEKMKDYWQIGQDNLQQYNYIYRYHNNPWFSAYENTRPLKRNNFFANYGLKFKIFQNFLINYLGGTNKIKSESKVNYKISSLNYIKGAYGEEKIKEKIFIHNLFLNYDKKIGKKHYINSFTGIYIENNSFEKDYYFQSVDSIYPTISKMTTKTEKQGFYGGFSYSWNNTFYTRFTLNSDTYIDFNKKRAPIFLALSIGLEFKDILKLPQTISKLNIQSGYSKAGLNIVPVTILGDIQTKYPFPTISEYSAGFVLGLMKNRILINTNWYFSKTKNGFIEYSVSNFYFFDYSGSIQNNGYELNLSLLPMYSRKLHWKSEISLFKNKNKVINIGEGILGYSQYVYRNITSEIKEGQLAGNLYGTKYKRYENQIVFENGLPVKSDERELLGNVNPDYILFFRNYFNIKKFTISLLLDYQFGGIYYSAFYSDGTVAGTLKHTEKRESGIIGTGVKWDETISNYIPNDIVVDAQEYHQAAYHIDESSIMDATSLTINELNITYQILVFQKYQMILSLFGKNLYTWSKNKDYNQSNLYYDENKFYRGMNNQNLPYTRTFGLKLQLKI